MNSNAVETLIGTLVIALAAGFLVFAYSKGKVGKVEGYSIVANFDRADGINEGTDVRISGIKIGSVVDTKLDPATFYAKVTMTIEPKVKIPEDSAIKVAVDGLLGSPYLSIEPGGAEKQLADGGELTHTQPSIDIVGLLSRAIFAPKPGANGGAQPGATNGSTGTTGGAEGQPQLRQPQGELPPGGGP
jgi:phospholipid/cholesterol/gamma-HCH transport system substrate-binding protein